MNSANLRTSGSRHLVFTVTDESRLVALMCLLAFLVLGLPRVFTASAAEALFLTTYGAQSLPYIFIIAAVVVPLVGAVYLRLQSRVSYAVLITATLILDGIALVALRLASLNGDPLISGLIAVWFEVEWVLTSLVVWGLANQLFDVRQSKRVFGLIGAGELVATIAGGFLTPLVVKSIGTPGLLLCSAAGVFLGAALITVIVRRFGGNLTGVVVANEAAGSVKRAGGSDRGYLDLIFAVALCSLFAYYCVDNSFYASAQLRYPGEDALAGFIGLFFALAGCAGLFCRLMLSRWMFARFGVKSGLLLLPTLLLFGSLSLVVCRAGGVVVLFALTTLNKLFDTMIRDPLYENAILTLYQALLPRRRAWAQTVVESQLEPLAGGIAGAGILALNYFIGFSVVQLAVVTIAVTLAWLAFSWKLKDRYVAMLGEMLERRRLAGDTLLVDDAAGLEQIRRILAGDRAEDILYAVTLLERSKRPELRAAVRTLLIRPEPLLRREAARIIKEHGMFDAVEAVRAQLEVEAEPAVKGALIRALGAVSESQTLDVLAPYLHAQAPVVRRDAIVALIEQGGIEGAVVAGDDFMSALRSRDPAERRLAAEVIGELHNPQFYRSLLVLLEDADMRVRDAALAAAARVDAPRVRQLVIRNLALPAVRRRAAAVLVAIGNAVVADLEAAFDCTGEDLETRLRIVAILARMRTPVALAALEQRLSLPGEMLNHAIVEALMRANHVASAEKRATYIGLLRDAVGEAAWVFAAADDLAGVSECALLLRALEARVVRQQERVFALLSFLNASSAVRDVYGTFVHGSPDKRALALEVLENALPIATRDLVLPVLEDGSFAHRRKRLEPHFPQRSFSRDDRLREIASRDDHGASPWLHACALHTIGILRTCELADCVHAAIQSPNALVRETANWAARGLDRSHSNEEPVMSTTVEKVIVLRTVEIFVSLPDEYLVDIARRVEEIDVAAGEKIIAEGELGSALFIIVDGSFRVHRGDVTLATLRTREIFGELTALDPQPRSADVTAKDDARLYKLDYRDLDEIISADAEVSRSIIKMLCRRLRASTAREGAPRTAPPAPADVLETY